MRGASGESGRRPHFGGSRVTENEPRANDSNPDEARRAWERAYYAKNIEKMREKQRQWRAKQSPEAKREKDQRYRSRHRETHLAGRRRQQRRKSMAICAAQGRPYFPRTKNNPVVRKLRALGISVRKDEMARLVAAQNGLCAICGLPPNGRGWGDTLCFDHDHATGLLRDLVCGKCNKGLGCFEDKVASLRSAVRYLLKHGKTTDADGSD